MLPYFVYNSGMFNVVDLIHSIGATGIISVIFAECGLFVGFFLPGDSLLFTAGFLASQGFLSIVPLLIFSMIAAILGENVGYAFGYKVGPMLFNKAESRFWKPAHVTRAHEFFMHHGNKAIFLARFIPVIRTFVPIVAGVARMPFRSFMLYNIVGAVVWIVGLMLLGYTLGSQVPDAEKYVTPGILVIIIVSFIPIYHEWRKSKKKS
jgi:membrane-associated protein